MLYGLDICAGSGIGSAAFEALGFARTICYVERDEYCQRLLRQRMLDGWLQPAPIWDDLKTFDGRPWRGLVDFIFGGIPCQPHSLAGKRGGAADERDLWPDFWRVVCEVGPRVVLIENVPGILSTRRNACICGGPDGWGGVHHDTRIEGEAIEPLLPVHRHRDGEDRNRRVAQDGSDVRGEGDEAQRRHREMGRGLVVAYLRGRCGGLSAPDLPIHDHQEATGNSGTQTSQSRRRETSRWETEKLDGRHALRGAAVADAHSGTQPTRARGCFAVDADGRCRVCGGAVGETAGAAGWNFGTILRDLAAGGYDAEWDCIPAAAVGAHHRRDRVWIVAYADGRRREECHGQRQTVALHQSDADSEAELANAQEQPLGAGLCASEQAGQRGRRLGDGGSEGALPVTIGPRLEKWEGLAGDAGAQQPTVERGGDAAGPAEWWELEPDVDRVADGVASRVDRLRTIGNGWVPQVAAVVAGRIGRRLLR